MQLGYDHAAAALLWVTLPPNVLLFEIRAQNKGWFPRAFSSGRPWILAFSPDPHKVGTHAAQLLSCPFRSANSLWMRATMTPGSFLGISAPPECWPSDSHNCAHSSQSSIFCPVFLVVAIGQVTTSYLDHHYWK